MQELRWLLEELRVSFFAQELRTPQPVSVKRLDKLWAQGTGYLGLLAEDDVDTFEALFV
jgi:hypothetical protein